MLWYEESLESDRYAAALARENSAFETLIRQKEYMVLPAISDPTQVHDRLYSP